MLWQKRETNLQSSSDHLPQTHNVSQGREIKAKQATLCLSLPDQFEVQIDRVLKICYLVHWWHILFVKMADSFHIFSKRHVVTQKKMITQMMSQQQENEGGIWPFRKINVWLPNARTIHDVLEPHLTSFVFSVATATVALIAVQEAHMIHAYLDLQCR